VGRIGCCESLGEWFFLPTLPSRGRGVGSFAETKTGGGDFLKTRGRHSEGRKWGLNTQEGPSGTAGKRLGLAVNAQGAGR